jgi:transcriptional regulator with XRE-family HTH domain
MPKRVIASEKPEISGALDLLTLGKHIRHCRTKLGITLEDAASLSGVSKKAYCNVEFGLDSVQAATLFKVADALGVKLAIIDDVEAEDDWG